MTQGVTRGFTVTDRGAKCPFDPSPRLDRLRQQEQPTPVAVYDPDYGTVDMLVVSRHQQVRDVLGDKRFEYGFIPLPDGSMPAADSQPGFMSLYHGLEHARIRRAVAAPFTPKRVAEAKPMIEAAINDCLDVMEKAGPGVDLVEAFALPVPSFVIGELLGVPRSERNSFGAITRDAVNHGQSLEDLVAATQALWAYVADMVAGLRRQPPVGIIGELLQASEEGSLSDEEIVGVTGMLIVAGHETTTSTIALAALALMQQPDQLAVLLDEAAPTSDAVEEILRYTTASSTFPRAAREDTVVGSREVKAGERVLVSLLNANRDPELVPGDPDKLDLSREPVAHVTFGHGIHQCMGKYLARLELELALPALFRRFPGLRPAVPEDELEFVNSGQLIYRMASLPVTW